MFNSAVTYIKNSLDGIKSVLITIKDILVMIADVIGTIIDILGFIGFRVFILLVITTFLMWIFNLISPITKKTNYLLSVFLVIWLALSTKMPFQIVTLKYILIIFSPFLLIKIVNYILENSNILLKIILHKINILIYKIKFISKNKNKENLILSKNIGLLFTSDLPTIKEINGITTFIQQLNWSLTIETKEKISLTDEKDRIIIEKNTKIEQFTKSLQNNNINILWFWSENFSANEYIEEISKMPLKKQNKLIIGSGDNSFILNFLQNKWNWNIIYGYNFKKFISLNLDDINIQNAYDIFLINDYNLVENYFLKSKIVGSDLKVLCNQIGTNNLLNFKNKILFLDGTFENIKTFYSCITHLLTFIVDKNYPPKAIIFGKITLLDKGNIYNTITYFSHQLKIHNIDFPIFIIKGFDFIKLNTKCFIEYKNSKLILNT